MIGQIADEEYEEVFQEFKDTIKQFSKHPRIIGIADRIRNATLNTYNLINEVASEYTIRRPDTSTISVDALDRMETEIEAQCAQIRCMAKDTRNSEDKILCNLIYSSIANIENKRLGFRKTYIARF